ncbi:helix-turn-helix transcriptional regulator [Mesorhizobium sp. AR10]|uniref:helix-turn-helix transcriptional regulator n=1 Tax=Mesorhizobium sp. AR10 TaxID=2865839 RepID=UPI00215EB729|nr:helix-turn-helix transcriptional regulator [Mesorhizobium sp. AR10]UVK41142.1 helix-turn-helix transcriptional regulator [Mesorhizobium sp. AR10]
MAGSEADGIASGGVMGRRLRVLIALGDAVRAERLSAGLAVNDDLLPVLTGGSDAADVAIVDGHALENVPLSGGAIDARIPRVVLSSRASRERPAGAVFAVLPTAADDLLIAAAVRLAAAGYRISGDGEPFPIGHDDFHDGGGDLFEDEGLDGVSTRPSLSPRESEVLALLAEGAPNKVIARRLNISVHTAKFHVAAILIKLGAANRTDAIAIAMRQGLVLV